MTPPYYTVTVTRLPDGDAGWSYATTHQDIPDVDDLVQLADGFGYRFGWDMIPGQRIPDTATVRFYCRDADNIPPVKEGQLIQLEVQLGDDTGPYILSPPPMRVADVVAELDPVNLGGEEGGGPFSYGEATPGYLPAGGEVTLPAHDVGDLLLVFAYRNDDAAINPPAGWSTLMSLSWTRHHAFYKVAESNAEPSTFNTITGSYMGYVALNCGTGVLPEFVSHEYDGTHDAMDIPNGTVGLLYFAGAYGWAPAVPGGTTELGSYDPGSAPRVLLVAHDDPITDPTTSKAFGSVSTMAVALVPGGTPPVDPDADPDAYAVELTVELVGLDAELRSSFVDRPLGDFSPGSGSPGDHAREYWQPRIQEIGTIIGVAIGSPSWWADTEQPHPGNLDGVTHGVAYRGLAFVNPSTGGWDGKSAHELLTQLMNSHHPDGITHAICPWYGSTHPTGYEDVAQLATYNGVPRPVAPASTIRYELVPASREAGWHGDLALNGDWVEVPAKARRTARHVINTVRVTGRAIIANEADPNLVYKWTDSAVAFTDAADAGDYGPAARQLPTALTLYMSPTDNPQLYEALAPAAVAARYLSDASVRAADWSYESFVLDAAQLTDAEAPDVLPFIVPRMPDEPDGDGQVLRHVTITNLAPSIRFGDSDVSGFLSSGALTIVDGELRFTLTLTPGEAT